MATKANLICASQGVRRIEGGRSARVATDTPRQQGVLIVVENLPVPFDRRVWQEALALREAGYLVSVICPKGKGYDESYEEISGIHVYRHKLQIEASGPVSYLAEYSIALFWELVLSLKVKRRHKVSVLHACNPPDLIFVIALYHKWFYGTKFLFDQHDINPELYEVKFKRRDIFYNALRTLERWTFRCADASLATSEALKTLAIERGGMAPDRVWVVRSFPDLDQWPVVSPDLSARGRFRHLIGYLGILGRQDGVDLLVEAMDHIVNRMERRDIGCLIIGDGPEHHRLQALSEQRGLSQYVEFCGLLQGAELITKLSACDIGVIPDPPNACNGMLSMNKVFEYMALGLPFVQFDLRQSRQDAGEAALIVQEPSPAGLARGILALLDDPVGRSRMSDYGRRRARKEFVWAKEKESLLAAYEALLGSAAPRPDASAAPKVAQMVDGNRTFHYSSSTASKGPFWDR